jgi:hypothetical protein
MLGGRREQPKQAGLERRPPSLAVLVGAALLVCAGALAGGILIALPSAAPSPASRAGASVPCPRGEAAARSDRALAAATARYLLEARGHAVHADLRRIARDPILLAALAAHDLRRARAEAERQLVNHVVRIRVLRGSRVLLDANSLSFDVAGSSIALRSLGRLEITVQDIIGYVKLVRKLDAAEVIVHGAGGHVHTSPRAAAAARLTLPRSGCARVGGRLYAVRTLDEVGFAGEALTISVLTPA